MTVNEAHVRAVAPDAPYLLERVRVRLYVDDNGCWIWTGSRDQKGYGYVSVDRVTRRVHRVVLEASGVALDSDLVVDHLCQVRSCANPAHLEQVPSRVNTMRGVVPTIINTGRCRSGLHDMTDSANVIVRRNGARTCRPCVRIYKDRCVARARAARETERATA